MVSTKVQEKEGQHVRPLPVVLIQEKDRGSNELFRFDTFSFPHDFSEVQRQFFFLFFNSSHWGGNYLRCLRVKAACFMGLIVLEFLFNSLLNKIQKKKAVTCREIEYIF